ncbi:hypothetical protein K3495_g6584 [Podosphaera aphanis]|nr:hypothetical protein K3495_g6584 [Podosphaera aphanis]
MEESLLLDFPNGECAPLPDSFLFNSEAEAFGWAQRQASTGGYAFSSLYKNKGKVIGDIILSCYNCDKEPKIYQIKPKITSKSKQTDGTGSKKCGYRELALMNSLEVHFSDTPCLLCRWHVNMNVFAKSKKHFLKPTKKGDSYVRSPDFVEFLKQWNAVLAATSEEIYEQEVAKLKAMPPKDAYIYVERTWLVWKEKIVSFWVDKQLHFGHTVTSTVEGCQSNLKDYLRRSTYDLKGVYDKLLLFWATQKSSIADTEAQDQQKPRHNTSHPILSKLIGRIHNYALQKLVLEIRKMPLVTEQVLPFLCVMRVAYGLTCFHEILKSLQEKRQLDKTDLHPHWWFKRGVAQNINMGIDILDPEITFTRVRPRGALGGVSREAESSTRRNPSEFEHIILEERSEAFRGRRRGQGPQRRDNSTINTPSSPLVVSTSLSTIPTRVQKRKRETEYETYHVASRAPLHRRVSRSSTALGIARLEASRDTYEPETTSERSSAMALSIIWRDGHIDEPDVITATLCAMGADDKVQDETTINDDGREVTVTNSI